MNEIREILRELDAGDGEEATARAIAPARGAPEVLPRHRVNAPAVLSGGKIALPNPRPAPAAALLPRNAATAAALAIAGLVVLGATNFAVIRGPALAHLLTAPSQLGDGAARAVLPPASAVLPAPKTVAVAAPPKTAPPVHLAAIARHDAPPTAAIVAPKAPAAPAQPKAAPPHAAAPRPLHTPPAAAAAPARFTPSAADRAEGQRLREAGDTQLIDGDIASARLFYERAAKKGDARAALALGHSFNPAFLQRLGVFGMQGDKTSAARWYQRARALGDPDAARALQTLSR